MAGIVRNPYNKIAPKTDAPLDLRGDMSEFGKGGRAFIDETQGIGGGLLALGAQGLQNIVGGDSDGLLQKAVDTGLEIHDRNMAESQAGKQAPAVGKIEGIKGLGDAGDFAAFQLGKGLPNLATLGLGSIVGRQVAKAGISAALKQTLKTQTGVPLAGKVVTKEMKDMARDQIKKQLTAGTVAGGFTAGAGFEGGSAFGEMVQEGVNPADAVGPAIAVGGLGGALEFTPFYAVAKKMGMGDFAKEGIRKIIKNDKELSKRAVALATATETARRAGGAGAVGALAEGATEGLQELAQIAGLRWAKGEDLFAELDEEDWSRIANASAAGTLVGGVAAGGVGTVIGPEGVQLPGVAEAPETDANGRPLLPPPTPPRERPQPRTGEPPIYGRDDGVREGEFIPRGEPVSPEGRIEDIGDTVEGEIVRPRLGQDRNRLELDEKGRPKGLRDNIIDADDDTPGPGGGGGNITPPQIKGPSIPPMPPVKPQEVDEGPTTQDLLDDYHRRTGTGPKQEAPGKINLRKEGAGSYQLADGKKTLQIVRNEQLPRGRQWQVLDGKNAINDGMSTLKEAQAEGEVYLKETPPGRQVQTSTPPSAPVPPDQLTVLGQDAKGDPAEIRSPVTDETQQQVDAERRGQGSFMVKVGTKAGKPFKSRGAAEAAVRRRGLTNALVAEEGDGYVIQTWPDQIETTEAIEEPASVATPEELQERLDQGEVLDQSEVVRAFDVPDRREILQELKKAYQDATLTTAQYDNLRRRVARDDLEYVFGSLQEMLEEGRDPNRAFMKGQGTSDLRNLIAMLGANMYKTGFVGTVIKELTQNAFDTVKAVARQTGVPGRLDIVVNEEARTVTLIDNGEGMSDQDINDKLLKVGGTGKGGKGTSGGKGLAKTAFIYGSDKLDLTTTKDGITYTYVATPEEILEGTVEIDKKSTPDVPNGTIITIHIPETVTLETGEELSVDFPYNNKSVPFLRRPLIGPAEVYYHKVRSDSDLTSLETIEKSKRISVQPLDEGGYGVFRTNLMGSMWKDLEFDTEQEALDYKHESEGRLNLGLHYDIKANGFIELPPMTTTWADIRVYVGIDQLEKYEAFTRQSVLSDGVYQFPLNLQMPDGSYAPHAVILDVKSKVTVKAPSYPFTNNREDWSVGVAKDVNAIKNFLLRYFKGVTDSKATDTFQEMRQLSRVAIEVGGPAPASVSMPALARTKQKRGNKKTAAPPQPKLSLINGQAYDVSGKIPKKMDLGEKGTAEVVTLEADEKVIPKIKDITSEYDYDPDKPLYHNNTNVDFLDEFGQPAAQFFSEIGSVVLDLMQAVGDLKLNRYAGFIPDNITPSAFGGLSIDKEYQGLTLKSPTRAFFLNPLGLPSYVKSILGISHSQYLTTIHEVAHNVSMQHDVTHTNGIHEIYDRLAEEGLAADFEEKFKDVYYRHRDIFNQMRKKYEQSDTNNVAVSLDKVEGIEGGSLARGDDSGTVSLSSGEAALLRGSSRRSVQPGTNTAEELGGNPRRIPRDPVDDELFSRADAPATRTAAELRAELVKFLGETLVKRLEESGLLQLHDRAHHNGASGSFSPSEGVAHIWGGSIGRGKSALGVLLHEGGHVGLDIMLGGRLNDFVDDIFAQARQGNKIAQAAIEKAIPPKILNELGLTEAALIEVIKQNYVAREEVVAYYIQFAQDAQIENGVTRRLWNQLKVAFARSPFGRAAKAMGMGFELTPEMATEYARAAVNDTLLAAEWLGAHGAPSVQSSVPGSLNLELETRTVDAALDVLGLSAGNEYIEWKNTGQVGDKHVTLASQVQMKANIDRDQVTKTRHLADGLPKELADTEVKFTNLGTGWGARRNGTIYLDTGIGNRTAGLLKPTLLREMDRALEDQRGWTGFEPPSSIASYSALGRLRADAYTLLPTGQVRAAETLREVERIQSDPILAPVVNELMEALERGDNATAKFLMDRMGDSIDPKLLDVMGLQLAEDTSGQVQFSEATMFAELYSTDKAVQEELVRLGQQRMDRTGSMRERLDAVRKIDNVVRDRFTNWLLETGPQPEEPTKLYRGVQPGTQDRDPNSVAFEHATPWATIADAGGQLGGPQDLDILEYDIQPGQRYYRGGALAGDPLESTRVNSIQGMSWADALKRAKTLYERYTFQGLRDNAEFIKGLTTEQRTEYEASMRKNAAEQAFLDFKRGTYETDALNRPGVWANKTPPRNLMRNMPELRTREEVAEYDAQEFQRWFQDSVVVNEDGTPKVLFHGRADQGPIRESFEAGLGIFLTDNEMVADTFTVPREFGEQVADAEPGPVYRMHAQIKNPLILEGAEAQRVVDDTAHQIQVLHQAKRAGHDGVVLVDVMEGIGEQQSSTNYVVFKPRQLRKEDGTRRFAANSPEELYSITGEYLEVYNKFRKVQRAARVRASEKAGFTVHNLRDVEDILGEDLTWISDLEKEVEVKEDAFLRGFYPDPDQPLDLQAERENLLDEREIERRREAFKRAPLYNIKSMEEFVARMETAGIPEIDYDSESTKVLLIEGIPVSLELQWNGDTMEMAFEATEAKLLDRYGYKDLLDFRNSYAATKRIVREITKLSQGRLAERPEGDVIVFSGTNDQRQRIYEELFRRLGVKLEDRAVFYGTLKAMHYQPELELESNPNGSAVDNLFEATYAKLRATGSTGVAIADDMEAFDPNNPDELYSFADTVSGIRRWAWTDPSDPARKTNLGAFQRWYTNYVDNLSTIEKKSKSIWDRFDLAKSMRGNKLDEINRRFFHPLKEAAAKTGLTLDEINDWIAARHIYLDDVNRKLTERASHEFAKDLAKHLPRGKKKEFKEKVALLRKGRTELGEQLSPGEARRRMAELVDEYIEFEIPSIDFRVAGGERAKVRYEWNHFKQHASGMFVAAPGLQNTMGAPVAKDVYEQHLDNRELERVAEIFDQLTRHQLDLLVEGGNLTESERAALLTDKQHYAPLRREAFDFESGMDFLGKGGRGPAKGVKFRGGSIEVDRPVHALQNALARAHAAAGAAQKNLANKYLYEAIQNNRREWEGWFSIDEDNDVLTMDSQGFLQKQQSPNANDTDLVVILNGKRLLIRPVEQNERAIRFTAAANKLEAQAQSGAFKVFGWINTIVRFTAVSASPAFLVANLVRDPLTAIYNMQASEAAAHTDAIVKSYKKTFAALYDVYMKGNRDPTNANVQMVERFEKAGGRISFVQSLRDMDETWGSFRTHMWAEKTPGVKQLARTFKAIEDANIAVENIMRLATFTQLADSIGDAQAARIAKDLTTNFDRRGFRTQTMGLLYLFFNATVQGNVQVIKNLAKSRRLMKMVGGTIAVAGIMDMMGRALADDDDDGKSEWDKIPLYEKERNIILPFKIGGEYIKIPAPWVYNMVWRTGGMLSEFTAGARSGGDIGVDLAAMSLNTFNPLGGGSFAQGLAPTALDPLVQVVENKDFAGNTMRPMNFPGAGAKADAHLAWAATPKEYKWIAQTLNELSGGDIANSGWIDVHPSTVQNTVNFLGGGLVRFASNVLNMPRVLMAEELEVRKIPVIRQFTARPTSQIDTQLYHERTATVLAAEKAVKEYGRGETRDPEKQAQARERYAKELRLVDYTKDVERQLRSLRQRRRAAVGRKDETRANVLKDRIEQVQREYNKTFERRVSS